MNILVYNLVENTQKVELDYTFQTKIRTKLKLFAYKFETHFASAHLCRYQLFQI